MASDIPGPVSGPLDQAFLRPLRLDANPVYRFYAGGRLLGAFRTGAPAEDGDKPEDWVGSVTPAVNPPEHSYVGEGLSRVHVPAGEVLLRDLLTADPVAVAGRRLVEAFGVTTGVLVKLLDAGIRLPIHAHPTRAFAREHLASPFGKAEAWLVVETRQMPGEESPCVRVGFRESMTRAELLEVVRSQRVDRLREVMHRFEVGPGDVVFVPPGVPHSTGAGVFLVEVQEPTDFSIVLEWTGYPITPEEADIGLGWDLLAETLRPTALSADEVAVLRAPPRVIARGSGGEVDDLLGAQADAFFRARRARVSGAVDWPFAGCFSVGIVTAGEGRVTNAHGSLDVRRGDTLALLAAAPPSVIDGSLEVIALGPADVR
jgi:mannose-6-phosphate isomerase